MQVLLHARNEYIVPTPNGFGRILFATTAVADYTTWLREHPDGRLQRFNATTPERARFRATWYRARFKSEAEFGRQASALASARGKRTGRRRELDARAIAKVNDMAARGKSQRAIAATVGCTRGQVRRLLASKESGPKPPLGWVETPGDRR
jgi:hypothetical protein